MHEVIGIHSISEVQRMNNSNSIFQAILYFIEKKFPDYEELKHVWKNDLENLFLSKSENVEVCDSLKSFLNSIYNISIQYDLELQNISQWMITFSDQIKREIQELVESDFLLLNSPSNEDLVKHTLGEQFIEISTDEIIHKLRDTISKNEFHLNHEQIPTAVIENEDIKALTQVRNSVQVNGFGKEELEQWKNLTTQAITAMDDLTADIFDIISFMWMKKAATKDQMIHFHADDALNLRKLQGRNNVEGYQTGYRKKDRIEIMKRLAALTTIYIQIERDKLNLIDPDEQGNETEDLKGIQFNPLFVVDSVTVAYRGDEPVGIYECQIKPGEVMANFLYRSHSSNSYLALKTLEYNPYKERYHKRLCRYLSWQWRIKQTEKDFEAPYYIGGEKGLLKVMGLKSTQRYGTRVKEQFESVLERLQADSVIKEWFYIGWSENIIEYNVDWYHEWLQCQVVIIPIDYVTKSIMFDENPRRVLFKLFEESQSQEEDVIDEADVTVTPQLVKEERERRKLSLSKAAKQMGFSHSTLSRYESGKIIAPTPATIEKIAQWLKKQSVH